MAYSTELPFEVGSTYFAGRASADIVIDEASSNYEGREYVVDDIIMTPGSTKGNLRSRSKKTLRIVRNTSTIALAAKRAVVFQNGYFGRRVDGYNSSDMGVCALVDEYIGSAGVPVNDLFYIVIEGPATGKSPNAANGNFMKFLYGVKVWGLSAAASTSATAGRLRVLDTYAQDATSGVTDHGILIDTAANVLGHSQTTQAATTNSDVDILVHLKRMF